MDSTQKRKLSCFCLELKLVFLGGAAHNLTYIRAYKTYRYLHSLNIFFSLEVTISKEFIYLLKFQMQYVVHFLVQGCLFLRDMSIISF